MKNKELEDMRTPVLRLNTASFEALNKPDNELDEIRERQEYAFNRSREQTSG
jgi:hypothetical protein